MCLIFWGTPRLYSKATAFCLPISKWVTISLHHCKHCFCPFFVKITIILMGLKWYFTAVLHFLSWLIMVNIYVFHVFSLEKCLCKYLPISKLGCYTKVWGYQFLISYVTCKYFLPFYGLSFHFTVVSSEAH